MAGKNQAPGASHDTGADGTPELTADERWLRAWAFGTSPYGLGLTPEAFWHLAMCEYMALKDVYEAHQYRWAVERAMFANAHFRGKDDPPYEADDFLGRGNRERRRVDSQKNLMDVMRANAHLARMRPGDPPDEDIPEWAKGTVN